MSGLVIGSLHFALARDFVCLNYLRKVLSITLDGSLLILPNSARLSSLKRQSSQSIQVQVAQVRHVLKIQKKYYLLCGEQTGGLLLLLLHKVAELGFRAEPVHHRLHLNSRIEEQTGIRKRPENISQAPEQLRCSAIILPAT